MRGGCSPVSPSPSSFTSFLPFHKDSHSVHRLPFTRDYVLLKPLTHRFLFFDSHTHTCTRTHTMAPLIHAVLVGVCLLPELLFERISCVSSGMRVIFTYLSSNLKAMLHMALSNIAFFYHLSSPCKHLCVCVCLLNGLFCPITLAVFLHRAPATSTHVSSAAPRPPPLPYHHAPVAWLLAG